MVMVALTGVVRLWIEALLRRHAVAVELVEGVPRARYAVAAGDVVALLDGAGRPAPAELEARAEAAWQAAGFALAGLGDLELRIVAALLGPELDPDLERIYAYAWNDFTRRRPDVGFLVDLIGGGDEARRAAVRAALATEAPLRRGRFVEVGVPADADTTPPLRRVVRLADRVIAHLLGDGAIDPVLDGVAALAAPARRDELVLDGATVETARRALEGEAPRVLLWGAPGTGKTMLVRGLAGSRPVVTVDVAELGRAPDRLDDRMARIGREAVLRGAVTVFRGGASLADDRHRLAELSRRIAGPVVYTAHARPPWLVHAVPELVEVAVESPAAAARVALWTRALAPAAAAVAPGAVDEIVARFALGGGAIERAAERAITQARLRDPAAPRITLDDLTESARLVLQHRLGTVARRLEPGFTWDDLILADDTLEVIREVVDFARHRTPLLERWGFGRKLPYGRGVSAILGGPPGTGKTMVAQLLARELGYELYLIELSQVVNKYIGETEKNLARVFDEAEGSHAILFFDEADALFAKRTEVKSSTDRYANLEVNYLLQRMESYNGITLLATNLEQGIDEAFKRRVRFTIQFDLPEAPDRERLWRSMFPPEVTLADDIDWQRLATRYEMSGGYIKKAAVRAAARALQRGGDLRITGADVELAAQLEYREMGRVV